MSLIYPKRAIRTYKAVMLHLFLCTTHLIITTTESWTMYPPYCSKPSSFSSRAVPPIDPTHPLVQHNALTLQHVTAVIRHGARAPWSAHRCWEGYDVYSDPWDCDQIALSVPPRLDERHDTRLWFERRYDAHVGEIKAIRNKLGGTCRAGQLITEGYDQQIENGRILRDAYIRDSNNSDIDSNYVLFDLDNAACDSGEDNNNNNSNNDNNRTDNDCPYAAENIYYRADDIQRTLESGQTLLQSFLEPFLLIRNNTTTTSTQPNPIILPIHTNDIDTDIFGDFEKVCPRLDEMWEEVERSDAYQARFVSSEPIQKLRKMYDDVLGGSWRLEQEHALDCLMTTICTDRMLPDVLDDYESGKENEVGNDDDMDLKYGKHRFQRVADYAIQTDMFVFNYNNSKYAKLAMVPLWSEIRSIFLRTNNNNNNNNNNDDDDDETPPLPKFALFSGHDTTLMGLLASLDTDMDLDSFWPPYASMFLIEKYHINTSLVSSYDNKRTIGDIFPSNAAFRMVYNGEVITHRIRNCEEELCDIGVLQGFWNEHMDLSRWERDCAATADPDDTSSSTSRKKNGEGGGGGVSYGIVIVLCILCTLFGSMITMKGTKRNPRRYEAQRSDDDGVGGSKSVYDVVTSASGTVIT